MQTSMKICPSCGEEYVLAATTCSECGVALGFEAPGPAGAPELGPVEGLVALRHAEVSWIEGLAAALSAAGIASRVELPAEFDPRSVQGRGTGALRCTLYVRREDAPGASQIDAEFARGQVPDLPAAASSAWSESEACPGCGSPLPADAEECPECGLSFGGGE
jgi:ribosomal protein L40E